MEQGGHWRWSCRLNACLGGHWKEPLCSRAWRRSWRVFIDAMQIAWRDPVHCEDVHLRWRAMQVYKPRPVTGRTGPSAGY